MTFDEWYRKNEHQLSANWRGPLRGWTGVYHLLRASYEAGAQSNPPAVIEKPTYSWWKRLKAWLWLYSATALANMYWARKARRGEIG